MWKLRLKYQPPNTLSTIQFMELGFKEIEDRQKATMKAKKEVSERKNRSPNYHTGFRLEWHDPASLE